MTNKQDLIKWMTEIRENLTFENKSQFLKDFWDNRDRLKNLDQLEKEVEAKDQDLSSWASNLENKVITLLKMEQEGEISENNKPLSGEANGTNTATNDALYTNAAVKDDVIAISDDETDRRTSERNESWSG